MPPNILFLHNHDPSGIKLFSSIIILSSIITLLSIITFLLIRTQSPIQIAFIIDLLPTYVYLPIAIILCWLWGCKDGLIRHPSPIYEKLSNLTIPISDQRITFGLIQTF